MRRFDVYGLTASQECALSWMVQHGSPAGGREICAGATQLGKIVGARVTERTINVLSQRGLIVRRGMRYQVADRGVRAICANYTNPHPATVMSDATHEQALRENEAR